jgi:hypothetical protein
MASLPPGLEHPTPERLRLIAVVWLDPSLTIRLGAPSLCQGRSADRP